MQYQFSTNLDEVKSRVISENKCFSHLANVRIKCIKANAPKTSKGKVCYADTEKLNDKHKFLSECDFVITFYENAQALDSEHLKRLMYHELLHVGFDPETEKMWINPHTIEDFTELIEKFGTDWISK